ncbi:Integrin alpha ina-1 [Fasciola gigantica]|uniref:Integrin alpha ina-1 n=1 Tax=Fasciola gigantica TaxID=46835 RepID=A0A504YW78_FASGI|nr:Integrin alpha ina-1 [Fasciola gigantica]
MISSTQGQENSVIPADFKRFLKTLTAGLINMTFVNTLSLAFLIEVMYAFNIDVHAPLLKNGSPKSNFGFSLVGFTLGDRQKGLVIGSPTGGDDGEVYWCPRMQSTCRRVEVDVAQLGRRPENINGSLFGYSLSSLDPQSPGRLTVCAPRLSKYSSSMLYVTGGCFQIDEYLKNPEIIHTSRKICEDIQEAAQRIDLRHCTMGGSIGQHPAAPHDLFMGGPYFHYAQGMGAIVETENFTRHTTSVEDLYPNTLVGSSLDTSNKIFAPRTGTERSLYVAFGGPGVPATGSKAETVGTGLVLFYPRPSSKDDQHIRPVLRLSGTQFGSRFGHSLILIDINGDGWDDLIVGAPYHYLKAEEGRQPNYGAVFVFLNQQTRFAKPVDDSASQKPFAYEPDNTYQIIIPTDDGHRCPISSISGFGAALNSLGDINHDGYEDFAVGAPYGEDGGLVFVYHGSKSGHIGSPSQVICREIIQTTQRLEGLGFAVGLNGLDLDGNTYPDMAIGAPLSDTVIVLRARPIVRFKTHIVLADGSTELPDDLNQLTECEQESRMLTGYHAAKVRCIDTRVFVTYSSIDGVGCSPGKEYPVTLILKSEPVDAWLTETGDGQQEMTAERKKRETKVCGTGSGQGAQANENDPNNVNKRTLYQQYGVPPISFVGERTVTEFGAQAERFFHTNRSAVPSGLSSPGGYLQLALSATCRESVNIQAASSNELAKGQRVRLLFRDVNLVDQTKPLSIGVKWVTDMPNPYSSVEQINQFPIADPKANTQVNQFTFKTPCFGQTCCPRIKVDYKVTVTRDKNGPVVHIGDDKAQTIEVGAFVTNVGEDPAYMVNLISNFPSMLLELDPTQGKSLRQDAAICHLANPLRAGESAQCTIRWHVIGHQLTVQMAYFYVNSSVVLGSSDLVDVIGTLDDQLRVNIKMVVNVSVSGSVEPSTAYFSGNVSDGISSIVAENHIGNTRLLTRFTVRNLRRHSLIPASRLIIDWPYEIAGDINEPHGKYLLYLLETPRVIQNMPTTPDEQLVNTSVVCDSRALEKLVNPHHYRVFSSLQNALEGVPVRTEPVDLPSSHPGGYPPLSSSLTLERVPVRLSDSKSQTQRKMTTVSCYNGALRCVPIACDLGRLSYKVGPITLQFSARLWDNTMRQDFKNVFLTKLRLSATWRADVKYGIDLDGLDHAQEAVELQIFNNLEPKPVPPRYMGLYIGLAVFGGVLLLALLVLILHKAGFFKRKRFFRRHPRADKAAPERKTQVPKVKPVTPKPRDSQTPTSTTQRHTGYQPVPQMDPYESENRSSERQSYPDRTRASYQNDHRQSQHRQQRQPTDTRRSQVHPISQGSRHIQAWDD